MSRLILILLTVIMIITIIKHLIRNYRIRNSAANKPYQNLKHSKSRDKNDDSNIIDAKFEEIK